MMARTRKLRAVDLFCGGGGTTTGAEQSGRVNVVAAVNHWQTAIDTHSRNHPHVQHFCTPIDAIDPRHDRSIPNFDLLLASPECTHHSIARGGMPVEDQKRAGPWHVLAWTEAKCPRAISVENVREFRDWGPLRQKRDKATGKLLWQSDGRPWMEPDPKHKGETFQAWVRALESLGYTVDHQILNAADYGAATKRLRLFITAIRSDLYRRRRLKWVPWPEPTHVGHHRAAYEIIDWSKPCPSIFGRKRPLAEKTIRRIEAGLRKFVEPFILTLRRNMDGRDIRDPLATITAGAEHHGLVVPFLSQFHNGPDGQNRNYSFGKPLDTITTKDRFGLAMVSLVRTMRELGVVDIGFRMLDVDELARATGFPEGYYFAGNKADRVKQVGNAVPPAFAKAICETLAEAA